MFVSHTSNKAQRFCAKAIVMECSSTPPAQPPAIHRKPVDSSAPLAPPIVAPTASTEHLSSFEASTLAPPSNTSALQANPLMQHENLSSFEAATLHERPAPAILPVDKTEKVSPDFESLENGSIAPYNGVAGKPSLSQRFDKVFPPHKKYFGRFTRKIFLLILLGTILLLVFIIGLSAGLGGKNKNKNENKPLPLGQVQTGELTYYDPGGPGYGSCGEVHYAEDAICAVSHLVYDSVAVTKNPNENPLCGRKIRVSRIDERDGKRKSIDCTVVDRCEGCKAEDVDLSPGMYNKIAAEDLGRVRGEWAWLD